MMILRKIYDPAPIPPSEEGAKLFVGRRAERETLKRVLSMEGGSRVMVESEYGVGKTSFINMGKYDKRAELLAPELEIDVERGWGEHEFLWYLLSGVLVKLQADHPKDFSRERIFKEALAHVERVKSTVLAGSVGMFSLEKRREERERRMFFPSFHFRKYMIEIGERVVSRLGYSGIIVHINNLDRLESEELKFFLNDIRDILLVPNYHFILAARVGTQSFVRRAVPRARIFSSLPITLRPLSKREVREAIELRMQAVGVEEPPIDWEVVNYLYDLSRGEIRYIFEMCNTLITEAHKFPTSGSITLELAKPFLAKRALDEVKKADLRRSQLLKLVRIAEHEPLEWKECAEVVGVSEKNLSNVLKPLEIRGLVKRTAEGIRTHTDVKLALELLRSELAK